MVKTPVHDGDPSWTSIMDNGGQASFLGGF
jgi:hypothetical protein